MKTRNNTVTVEAIRTARVRDLWEFLSRFHQDEFKPVGTNMLCLKRNDGIYIKRGFPGFNDFSDGRHGNSIDFLTGYMGYSFIDAVTALNESRVPVRGSGSIPVDNAAAGRARHTDIQLPEAAQKPYRRVYAYLMRRGIPADVIRNLEASGLLYQDAAHGNAVFVSRSRDYCELRGTLSYADKPFHGCRKAAPDRSWYVCSSNMPPQAAYICESAIDAISLLLIHRSAGTEDSAAYFSIGGVANQQAIDRIKKNIPQTVLAVDNDQAGQKCRERNQDLRHIIPFRKDWNEDLQAGYSILEGCAFQGTAR